MYNSTKRSLFVYNFGRKILIYKQETRFCFWTLLQGTLPHWTQSETLYTNKLIIFMIKIKISRTSKLNKSQM